MDPERASKSILQQRHTIVRLPALQCRKMILVPHSRWESAISTLQFRGELLFEFRPQTVQSAKGITLRQAISLASQQKRSLQAWLLAVRSNPTAEDRKSTRLNSS